MAPSTSATRPTPTARRWPTTAPITGDRRLLPGRHATESLATAFAAPSSFSVTSLTSADFTVNGSFDGAGNTNLLAPGNTLAVGASGTIRLNVRVASGGKPGPYTNQVIATGTSPASVVVTDRSQDGSDADPNHNGQSGDNNDPTVFTLPVNVVLIPTLSTWGLLLLAASSPLIRNEIRGVRCAHHLLSGKAPSSVLQCSGRIHLRRSLHVSKFL